LAEHAQLIAGDDDYLESAEDESDLLQNERAAARAEMGSGGSAMGPSLMRAFLECPERGRLRYHEGYSLRRDRGARVMGRLIHLGLAYYHVAQLVQQAKQALAPGWFFKRDLQSALLIEAGEDANQTYMDDTNAVVVSYVGRGDRELVNELFIEHEFSARLGDLDPDNPDPRTDNIFVTCRSDRVYEDQYGFVWIEDHKTKGRGRGKFGLLPKWHAYNEHVLDWQGMVNLHIVRNNLPDRLVKGFKIHRLQRMFPYDSDRNTVRISPLAYKAALRTMRKAVRIWLDTREEFIQDQPSDQHFNACYTRFGVCDYAPVCNAKDEHERQVVLSEDFKRAVTAAQEMKKARAA